MLDKFKRRSDKLEYIDTGDYTPEEYESCIGELQLVNRWMGDAHSLRATLFPEIEAQGLSNFSILDVGTSPDIEYRKDRSARVIELFDTRCRGRFRRAVACDCGLGETNKSAHDCRRSRVE